MTLLRFNAPPHHVLVVGEIEIRGGHAEEVPADVARRLLANPRLPVSEVDEAPPRSGRGSGRAAWAEYAQRQGLEVTDGMSREEIIAALDSAGDQPEADDDAGEGHPHIHEEEE